MKKDKKNRDGEGLKSSIPPHTNGAEGKKNLKRKAPQAEQKQEEAEADKSELPVNEPDKKTFSEGRFHDLGLAENVAAHIHDGMGFQAPTHIQREAIPVVVSGRDVLVNAGTGTGKTLVYLAPIVNALQGARKRVNRTDGTYAIVLVPTRELCVQVFLVAEKLVHRFIWLVPGFLMGGENRNKEKARLRKGITLLIATPGRLLDHLSNTNSFKIDPLKWLVFDEADRLLDLGFDKDIQSILSLLNQKQAASKQFKESERQHILLSATLDERVNKLAALSLRNPATVGLPSKEEAPVEQSKHTSVEEVKGKPQEPSEDEEEEVDDGDEDEDEDNLEADEKPSNGHTDYNIPSQLIQSYYKVPCKLRLAALLALMRQRSSSTKTGKLVIFFSTCDAVDFHFALMNDFQLSSAPGSKKEPFLESKVFRLHGNMPQKERTDTFLQFGKASAAFLICTDVASRGLDFKGVTCIVQYDPPGDPAEYVHRVGRTARIGEQGEAIIFLQPCEMDYLAELKKHGVTLKELPLPQLMDALPSDGKKNKYRKAEQWTSIEMHPAVSYMNLTLENFVAKGKTGEVNDLAVKAFNSYVRAYAAHKAELKPIFQVHKLHLGHVAKSFGLKSAPQLIGKMGMKASKKAKGGRVDKSRERNAQGTTKRRRLHAAVMEE
ncbi:ATP-dependent RNA helicase DDX31/DBP7 [Marchantia polymorpha subsp. ruderalis]|uniref:ATP-dependent RNA helicase n=2 Tax=Marchantia polymorpha TaxID=3197 RepID=A0AAF6BNR3_MARPO|nr:hypothetical protein MARPO_0167s0009 [Marchantia polymorpha]BBN13647.1 hypothetical protein Mp_6g05260 [Marchantia polymorpha subsp. ruderalis]|eukprot:PTQ28317.1 hypothetical protein MARPO_0167s0009 [Marchantia polymorpha]